jgi:hypothetical protein
LLLNNIICNLLIYQFAETSVSKHDILICAGPICNWWIIRTNILPFKISEIILPENLICRIRIRKIYIIWIYKSWFIISQRIKFCDLICASAYHWYNFRNAFPRYNSVFININNFVCIIARIKILDFLLNLI